MKALVLPNGSVVRWHGALPSSHDGWFVDIIDDPQPEPGDGQEVVPWALVANYVDGVPTHVRLTWSVIDKPDSPIGPVSKLTLKRRLGNEWPAVKAAIESNAEAHENWDLAVEIDPTEPQTAGMLAQLRGFGLITKTDAQLFAQQ